jgi:hypothetical protein
VSVTPQWQPERPCPIPGHPSDEDAGPQVIADSAWARMRRWHLHAPAERLPLPAIPGVWTAAEVLHVTGVSGLIPGAATVAASLAAGWIGERRQDPDARYPRMRGAEVAAVTAVTGGWLTAATALGPLSGPDHLLSIVYGLGSVSGYWWLRHHEAVLGARQRREDLAAEIADRREWHQILHRIGLDGWHVQERRETLIGEERLIVTSPENALASRIASASAGIAEKLAHILGLPYGRIDIRTTDFPGQLVIGIRTVDLSVRAAAYHPYTTPWPDKEPSPFAEWFPLADTIRKPVIWGFRPEDGSPLDLSLFSEIGGRAAGVIGMTGSGKSNVLNNLREKITRCDDARLVQLNGAHMGDELTWEPLSAITVCGPAKSDEKVRNDIAAVLAWACLLVTDRSATLAETGHSTFQPTEADPAVCIVIDEVDEVVNHVPGAGAALDFLAGKQRKSAMALVLATQRATVAALGGGGVRANMSQVLVGKVSRATESRHATGAESEIPDIREYSKGEPGYFQSWNPHSGTVDGRGRAFLLGKHPEELAYIKRLVAARRGWRDWSIPHAAPLVLDGGESAAQAALDAQASEVTGLRAHLAGITGAVRGEDEDLDEDEAPQPPVRLPAVRLPLTIPRAAGDTLLALLAAGGTSAAQAGEALGVSKTTALGYLSALRDAGVAELPVPRGRGSKFILASKHQEPEPPAAGQPGGEEAFTPDEMAHLIACWALSNGPAVAGQQARAGGTPEPLIAYGLHLAQTDPSGVAVRAVRTLREAGAPVPPWLTRHLPPSEASATVPPLRPDGYVTLHDLAEAVRDGSAGEVDDAAREVLAKVLEVGTRPRLTVVPEPERDAL